MKLQHKNFFGKTSNIENNILKYFDILTNKNLTSNIQKQKEFNVRKSILVSPFDEKYQKILNNENELEFFNNVCKLHENPISVTTNKFLHNNKIYNVCDICNSTIVSFIDFLNEYIFIVNNKEKFENYLTKKDNKNILFNNPYIFDKNKKKFFIKNTKSSFLYRFNLHQTLHCQSLNLIFDVPMFFYFLTVNDCLIDYFSKIDLMIFSLYCLTVFRIKDNFRNKFLYNLMEKLIPKINKNSDTVCNSNYFIIESYLREDIHNNNLLEPFRKLKVCNFQSICRCTNILVPLYDSLKDNPFLKNSNKNSIIKYFKSSQNTFLLCKIRSFIRLNSELIEEYIKYKGFNPNNINFLEKYLIRLFTINILNLIY